MKDDAPKPCLKLRAGDTYSGKQGFDYFEGISRRRRVRMAFACIS